MPSKWRPVVLLWKVRVVEDGGGAREALGRERLREMPVVKRNRPAAADVDGASLVTAMPLDVRMLSSTAPG